RAIGDGAAGNKALTYARYSVDNANSDYVACPSGAPTYSATNSNPCSQLTVPQPGASSTFHIRGTVTADGGPAQSWVVLIARDESGSHHYFANRADSDSNGAFDLLAA